MVRPASQSTPLQRAQMHANAGQMFFRSLQGNPSIAQTYQQMTVSEKIYYYTQWLAMQPLGTFQLQVGATWQPVDPRFVAGGMRSPSEESEEEERLLPKRLPMEIMKRIVMHLSPLQWEFDECSGKDKAPLEYLASVKALRNFSQVSSAYREMCLRLLWERVEICTTGAKNAPWYYLGKRKNWSYDIAQRMKQVCDGLVSAGPERLLLVKEVVISITSTNPTAPVLQSLNNLLKSCPNLTRLSIPFAHPAITDAMLQKNITARLLRLRELRIPASMNHFIKLAPNLSTVHRTGGSDMEILDSLRGGNKRVTKLVEFWPDDEVVERMVEMCPLLEDLVLLGFPSERSIEMLSTLKHIKGITIHTYASSEEIQSAVERMESCWVLHPDCLQRETTLEVYRIDSGGKLAGLEHQVSL